MKNLTRCAFAAVLSLGLAGTSLADCADEPARGQAFARTSPVTAFASPDAPFDYPLIIAFGATVAVHEINQRRARICHQGAFHWVRRSQLLQVGRPEFAVLPRSRYSVTRPKVQFWRSQERLSAFLAGNDTATAPPDYAEVIGGAGERDLLFPVVRRDILETSVGSRILEVASLLVPFPTEAVAAYARVKEEGGAAPLAPPPDPLVLVVDVSGSTEGLVGPYLADLVRDARAAGKIEGREIMLIEFGGDGYVSRGRTVSADDLASARLTVRAASGGSGDHRVGEAIAGAAAGGASPSLVILAGGDVSVDAVPDPARTVFGQITPELDDALSRSAMALGVAYSDFYDGGTSAVAAAISDAVPATSAEPAPITEEDLKPVIDAMLALGMMPLLPSDFRNAAKLVSAPASARDAEWFAVPLWTVINEQPLELK